MSNIETITEIGSVLVGYVQGVSDLSRTPSGVDLAAPLAGLAGVLSSAIGTVDTPFLKALSTGFGINISATGIVFAGIQLQQAMDAMTTAQQTGNPQLIAAAQTDLFDKTIGAFGAVGGLIAAIPTPQTKSVGLLIWGTATVGQQIYNGNAARLLDIIGPEVAEVIKGLYGGGKSIDVTRDTTDFSNIVTLVYRDTYGIPVGEYGKVQSGSKMSTVEVEHAHGWMVYVYKGGQQVEEYFRPKDVPESVRNVPMGDADWYRSLKVAKVQTQNGYGGFSSTEGNTVDFARGLLNSAGVSNPLSAMLTSGTMANGFAWNDEGLATIWNKHFTEGVLDGQFDGIAEKLLAYNETLGFSKAASFLNLYSAGFFYDPIVVDLDGGGIQTSHFAKGEGVIFDIDGDGIADKTVWISGNDAFLARDVNGNGQIDGATELFSGARMGDAYRALEPFDTNHDALVDASEASAAGISLWADANTDGITQEGELLSFDQAGLSNVSLAYKDLFDFAQGAYLTQYSVATFENGDTTNAVDVFFSFEKGGAPDLVRAPESTTAALTNSAAQLAQAIATFAVDERPVDAFSLAKQQASSGELTLAVA